MGAFSYAMMRAENKRTLTRFAERAERIIQRGYPKKPLKMETGLSVIFMPTLGSRTQFFEGESTIITDGNGAQFLL
jgi:hypothetical protein